MSLKSAAVSCALVMTMGILALPGAASAKPAPIDPSKVQALASQIEAALQTQGCGATSQQDMAAIQSTIAASGVSPSEAEAALWVVQTSPGLCSSARVAVASVDKTIELALAGSPAAPASGGGPGGAIPIGGPAAYVSAGGSDYLPH
jgi:hypothetical protein